MVFDLFFHGTQLAVCLIEALFVVAFEHGNGQRIALVFDGGSIPDQGAPCGLQLLQGPQKL